MVFSLLPANPSETIRMLTEVHRQHALTVTFYVLVDAMRLYGIQSPDPVALTSFSSIIRPLSVMFYAAKGDMAIELWFYKWKCSAIGYLWNLRFVQSERWPFMRSLRAPVQVNLFNLVFESSSRLVQIALDYQTILSDYRTI